MPTTYMMQFSNNGLESVFNPEDALQVSVAIKAAGSGTVTLQKGTVLGEVTANPGVYGAYASGNSDGTQNPAGILQYTVTVDTGTGAATAGAGNITMGTGTAGQEWGQVMQSTPMFISGNFRTQELTGLDAAGLTKLSGHLIEGSLTTGIVHIG